MNDLTNAFFRIRHEWQLRSNVEELAAALHTIQNFVIMHALTREYPQEAWGRWYGTDAEAD